MASSAVHHPSLDEPRSVVQQLVTKFSADCDIDSINKINEAYEIIQEHRAQKLSSSRDLLHQWMKRVETAKWESQRPADRPASRHAEEMSALERERFNLAKSINDLEGMIVQYEGLLSTSKTSLASLQAENAKNGKGDISRIEVEWSLFRDLGIEWLPEDPESCEGRMKCRVKDAERNDIFTTLLDDGKQTAVEQANLLWSLCCQ